MKTVLDTIQGGTEYLEKRGVEDARLTMQLLLAKVLGCDRVALYMDYDRPLAEEELAPMREFLKRRGQGEPVQHILGSVEFYGREFKCDGRGLIPRPETEELVGKILERWGAVEEVGDSGSGEGEKDNRGGGTGRRTRTIGDTRVLDVGCGSGVIGLTLAAEWGEKCRERVLVDFSEEALALARENAAALELTGVDFVQSDLLVGVAGRTFDVVVANLPYVPSGEIPGLSREVQRDPHSALDGGEDGLDLVRLFCGSVRDVMAEGGMVALEIGGGQGEAVAEMLRASGYSEVAVEKDLSGVGRFVFGACGSGE